MKDYNRVFAHAYTALNCVQDGLYKNEVILCAYDVSCFADKKRVRFKDKVIVCTDKRVLFIKNYKTIKNHIRLKDIRKVEVGHPDVTQIIFYTKDSKRLVIIG